MNDEVNSKAEKPEWGKTNAELRREAGLKPSRRKWWLLLVVVVGIGAFVLGSSQSAKPESVEAKLDSGSASTEVAAPEIKSVPVKYLAAAEVLKLEALTLSQTIKVTGSLNPMKVAQLPALISAQVKNVSVRAGDFVRQGQLLISMDTENLSIQKEQQLSGIDATLAQLALAESQLKRTQEMVDQGISPEYQLEQAVSTRQAQAANLQAQKGQVKATDYQLRNANIFAPITGVIAQRQVEPGQFVGVGSPMLSVVDLSVMELVANVSIADSARIQIGMPVKIKIEGIDSQNFVGKVVRISPTTLAGTRTLPVYIQVNNESGQLRGGMFAIGQIELAKADNVLAIPESAVRKNSEQGSTVFKVVDNVIVEQQITLAQQWGEAQLWQVSEGLAAGDTLVVLPLPGLMVGDAVTLLED